jgi:hypothetical protein
MKNVWILATMLLTVGFAGAQDFSAKDEIAVVTSEQTIPDGSELAGKEAVEALLSGDCSYNGIQLWGKVQFVTSFPDIKIQYVESFPDIRVKFVSSFPDRCGLWQITESFPDFKVQVVESFPDVKIKVVDSFPGVD